MHRETNTYLKREDITWIDDTMEREMEEGAVYAC
jgi:hypothetical protein